MKSVYYPLPFHGEARTLFFLWILGRPLSFMIQVYGKSYVSKKRLFFLNSFGFDLAKPYSPDYFCSCLFCSKDRY